MLLLFSFAGTFEKIYALVTIEERSPVQVELFISLSKIFLT